MSASKLSEVLAWFKEHPGKRPKRYNNIRDEAEARETRVNRMLYRCRQKADAGQLDADTDAALTEVMCSIKRLVSGPLSSPLQ
jgi:hypothetical protein